MLPGVGIGVVLSILALIHRASYPATAVLGRLPGNDVYRDVSRRPDAETLPGVIVFRFDAAAFFSNAGHFATMLEHHIAEAREPVRAVLVDAESINFLDATAAEMLIKLHAGLAERGITLSFARVRHRVRETMRRAGLEDAVGVGRMHASIQHGVEALAEELRTSA